MHRPENKWSNNLRIAKNSYSKTSIIVYLPFVRGGFSKILEYFVGYVDLIP